MTVAATLTSAVLAAMEDAGRNAIMPRYRSLSSDEVTAKAADDVVTVADHDSEAILVERLSALVPEASIVAEEAAHADPAVLDRLASDLCWIVDPLDGTNNFAAGKAPFGILVALADRGETIGGWLYDCLSHRLCHAIRGGGAFMNGEPIAARASGENPPIAAISTIFLEPDERAQIVEHIAPHYWLVDIPRCAAEQYPRLVLGQNDLSLFNRTLPWDHAAGILLLNEAGGKAARPDGTQYRVDDYMRPGLIGASTPALWEEIAERMAAIP